MNHWNNIVGIVSAEWLLNRRDNGGSIIALRSIILSALIFLMITVTVFFLGDKNIYDFLLGLAKEIKGQIALFGVLFGSIYAALYTRFSSQWAYLANLYNMIKQASVSKEIDKDCLAEWKAGFIEDAEYLHLSHKENFVSIINAWGSDEKVKEKYNKYSIRDGRHFEKLMCDVRERCACIRNENIV